MEYTGELLSIDRFSTSPVMPREIPTLKHELEGRKWFRVSDCGNHLERGNTTSTTHLGNDPVKMRVLIPETMLPSSQLTEVLSCLGYNVVVQFEHNSPCGFLVDVDVEEDF